LIFEVRGVGDGAMWVDKAIFARVVYHGVTSSFFSIGILLVSDVLGFRYFGRYCCTVSFGGNTFLRFRGNSFFEKFRGNSFFLQKEGEVYKKAEAPPSRKKGAPANFLRGSRQSFDTENTDRDILWYRYW